MKTKYKSQLERATIPIRRKTLSKYKKQAKKKGMSQIDYLDFLVTKDDLGLLDLSTVSV